MANGVIYRYDGSYEGFLCCVYESFYFRETPSSIEPYEAVGQVSFCQEKNILTNLKKAEKTERFLWAKLSEEGLSFVKNAFLTFLPQKEEHLYRLIRKGCRKGSRLLRDLSDPDVFFMTRAVRHLENEAHLLRGFIRFEAYNEVLIAMIEPENDVLPLLGEHFSQRFNTEHFMIYDKQHKKMLVYQPYQWRILPNIEIVLPKKDEKEKTFQKMWKVFHETIAIKERENKKCQQTHMPKRYWNCMHEMKEDIEAIDVSQTPKLLDN